MRLRIPLFYLLLAIVLAGFIHLVAVLVLHRTNIARLRAGTESRFARRRRRSDAAPASQ